MCLKSRPRAQLAQSSPINDLGHIRETPRWPAPCRTEFNFPGSGASPALVLGPVHKKQKPALLSGEKCCHPPMTLSLWPQNQFWGSLTQLETVSHPEYLRRGGNRPIETWALRRVWPHWGKDTHTHTFSLSPPLSPPNSCCMKSQTKVCMRQEYTDSSNTSLSTYYVKAFLYVRISLFNLHTNPKSRNYCVHFTEEAGFEPSCLDPESKS